LNTSSNENILYMKVYQKNALNKNMTFVYVFVSRIMSGHGSLHHT
jgi:hypothetical protein